MLHLHHFHHVQIHGFARFVQSQDSVDDDLEYVRVKRVTRAKVTNIGQDIGVLQGQFRAQRSLSDLNQRLSIGIDRNFQLVQNEQGFLLRQLEPFGNNSRVKTLNQDIQNVLFEPSTITDLGNVEIRLFEQFTNDQNNRRRSITGDIILSRCRTSNERRRGMLHLLNKHRNPSLRTKGCSHHFMQECISILGDLDISGTRDQPRRDRHLCL